MIRYPVLIEEGNERKAFGVVVPDLPGCFSAGDTLDDALDNAREAIAAWVDAKLDAGEAIPAPSQLDSVRRLPDYRGWTLAVVELDEALFDDTIERVNITLPKRVLRRLDDLAADREQSRGGFIAELTRTPSLIEYGDPIQVAIQDWVRRHPGKPLPEKDQLRRLIAAALEQLAE
jgi:predicted RNase H-like HicB family nuclease